MPNINQLARRGAVTYRGYWEWGVAGPLPQESIYEGN